MVKSLFHGNNSILLKIIGIFKIKIFVK